MISKVLGIAAFTQVVKTDEPLKVLVFGDSQGDVGPTYQVLEDVLGSQATVINKSEGGTRAC